MPAPRSYHSGPAYFGTLIGMAAAALPVRSCLVDGEVIVDDDSGIGIGIFDRSAITARSKEERRDEPRRLRQPIPRQALGHLNLIGHLQ
jgi:ATP-dependent DNA ligase